MTIDDPRIRFAAFYGNPAIRTLAGAARWTISGRLGDDPNDPEVTRKAPIDLRSLLDHNRLRGAWSIDEQCLVVLDELTDRIPTATNTAFYLRASTDGLIVIDIEPDCPAPVAAQLLKLPDVLYAEESMSGRGFHLVTPLPDNFAAFPIAAGKRVLREEQGWYEILLDHWVTFTRRPLPPGALARPPTPCPPFASVADVYADLAQHARTATASAIDVNTGVDVPDIPGGPQIVRQTLAAARHRFKTLDHFDGDRSRYEFSVLGTLHRQMLNHLVEHISLGRRYSSSDLAWLLFQAAQQVIPARAKHNERRNGRPFLLDRAAAMVAQQESDA
ncbi:hypothetical protein F1D05_09675 [Kribbella qitaiheensis]|uniref:Bifunctional DNA primase/polymerase n=1 Tax=Kribbella qitaiheensis TaxID=1544730 RepID=A0A7G6WVU2_9ACTN|nr:hypothetical protein [Kribbella qitaiheensis]QNE18107.1 hypothetical protein F1D05_09675 [Kribbella qitaiheensis]